MPDIAYQDLKSPIEVKVDWKRHSTIPPLTLSISALMLNNEDVINRLEDFVFYGTPNNGSDIISSDKSVTCDALNFEKGFGTESSYKMNLDLGKVSNTIDRINIVVSINTKANDTHLPAFDSLTKATFSIKDAAGLTFTTELNKTGESSCRCITVGLVRRYAQSWRFEEEMELKLGGLELVYNEYMCDSIINSNPFSKIGDLTIIEKKYKETEENTQITKDGDISIIKKVKEYTSTTIKKISDLGKDAPKRKGVRFQNAGHQTESVYSEGITATTTPSNSKPRKGRRYKVNNMGEEQLQDGANSSQQSIVESKTTSRSADGKVRKGVRYQNNNSKDKDTATSLPDIQKNKKRGLKFKK